MSTVLKGFQTKAEHAAEFDVCERTIDRWCDEAAGLPFTRAGRRRLFSPEWTRTWLESKRVQRNPTREVQRGGRRRE